jgi:hypothetical protein
MFGWTVRLTECITQITELAGYIAQSRPEPERAPYVQSIEQKIAVEEGQTPLSEDIERRREVFSAVFGDVKGLGEGTERGAAQNFHHRTLFSPFLVTEIEGFFNLLYAHLLTLWPVDSPETKNRVSSLLPIITSSTTESAAKYRMCVFHLALSVHVYYPDSCLFVPYPPPKSIKPFQHTSTTLRSPSPCLQNPPRACKFKR